MGDIKESGVHMGFIMPIQSYILIEMGDKNLNQTNVRTTKGQGCVCIDYSVVTIIILHRGYLPKQCGHLGYSAQGISNQTNKTVWLPQLLCTGDIY